jgi:hypothetical protein
VGAGAINQSSADDPEQNHDNCDYQQNVNETAHGVGCNQSKQPQDNHDDSDGIKHDVVLSLMR